MSSTARRRGEGKCSGLETLVPTLSPLIPVHSSICLFIRKAPLMGHSFVDFKCRSLVQIRGPSELHGNGTACLILVPESLAGTSEPWLPDIQVVHLWPERFPSI